MDQLEYGFCTSIDFASLEKEWVQLHNESQASFFLSWQWISTWLEVYKPNALLLRVARAGKTVGLALFHPANYTKFKLLPRRKLCLHQMGDEQRDQIWVEHNAVLCAPLYHDQIHSELPDQFLKSDIVWDTLVFSGVQHTIYQQLRNNSKTLSRELWRAPCYAIDLRYAQQNHTSYIASLSRNTRYQINRAIKGWETLGKLKLVAAKNDQEREHFFNFAAQQHKIKWGKEHSGFYNPYFYQFHRALLETWWSSNCIDLLALTLNDAPVAVLYNFKIHNTVSFYLSGIDYNHDPKLKPGLVIHALAIQNYMDLGYHAYDFLGGAAQYKSSLGKATQDIAGIEIMRKTTEAKLETKARALKSMINPWLRNSHQTQRLPRE